MPQRVKHVEKNLSNELRSRKKDVKHNVWNANNEIGMPKETSMCDNKAESGLDDYESSEFRDNSDDEEETDSSMKGQGNDRRVVDENKKWRKKSKDFEQCPFEMIDAITKTMSKLEKL